MYILAKGDITITAPLAAQVSFKNSAPFTKCITKIDETTIDDVEDLDLVIPIYNLEKYNSNNSETTESLWFYSKDGTTNFSNNIENSDNFKSFNYQVKLLQNAVAQLTPNNANQILKNATVAVPLKY